jgi:rare lipoprotein A
LKQLRISNRRALRDALVASAVAAAVAGGVPSGAHAHALSASKPTSATAKNAKREIAVSRSDHAERRTTRAKLFALHPTPRAPASHTTGREVGDAHDSGMASVYSDSHTASGEAMISGAMTAAHRSLPFGTHVTVVNRHNGRSVVVRINDRGPFVRGRVIDLSPAAARALGVDGLASVSLSIARERRADAEIPDGLPNQSVAADDGNTDHRDTVDVDHVAVDYVDPAGAAKEQQADAR